jgi:hypothetical protein
MYSTPWSARAAITISAPVISVIALLRFHSIRFSSIRLDPPWPFRFDFTHLGHAIGPVGKIKKGLKSPSHSAPPRLAGGSSTHGGAPSYEDQRSGNQNAHATCLFSSRRQAYMRGLNRGQAEGN